MMYASKEARKDAIAGRAAIAARKVLRIQAKLDKARTILALIEAGGRAQ